MAQRATVIASELMQARQVEVGIGEAGIEAQRRVITSDGGCVAPKIFERNAAVEVQQRYVGAAMQGCIQNNQRLSRARLIT